MQLTVDASLVFYDLAKVKKRSIEDVEKYVVERLAASAKKSAELDPSAFCPDWRRRVTGTLPMRVTCYWRSKAVPKKRARSISLPPGLEAYYREHWQKMGMSKRPVPRGKIRIIYVLCEAKRPLSRRVARSRD